MCSLLFWVIWMLSKQLRATPSARKKDKHDLTVDPSLTCSVRLMHARFYFDSTGEHMCFNIVFSLRRFCELWRANENSLFIFWAKKMAKDKNLKRKSAPVVKKATNEWLDETIEPSDEEEVCNYLFLSLLNNLRLFFEVRQALVNWIILNFEWTFAECYFEWSRRWEQWR